jgi:hypothetical protein
VKHDRAASVDFTGMSVTVCRGSGGSNFLLLYFNTPFRSCFTKVHLKTHANVCRHWTSSFVRSISDPVRWGLITKQRRSPKKELHYAFFHCIERSLSCRKILFCRFYIPFLREWEQYHVLPFWKMFFVLFLCIFSYVSAKALYLIRNKITVSPIMILFLVLSRVTLRKTQR